MKLATDTKSSEVPDQAAMPAATGAEGGACTKPAVTAECEPGGVGQPVKAAACDLAPQKEKRNPPYDVESSSTVRDAGSTMTADCNGSAAHQCPGERPSPSDDPLPASQLTLANGTSQSSHGDAAAATGNEHKGEPAGDTAPPGARHLANGVVPVTDGRSQAADDVGNTREASQGGGPPAFLEAHPRDVLAAGAVVDGGGVRMFGPHHHHHHPLGLDLGHQGPVLLPTPAQALYGPGPLDHPGAPVRPTSELTPEERADVCQRLRFQIEFYLSRNNLVGDHYLKSQMNNDMYVDISVLAGFKKVTKLTYDTELIVEALRDSQKLQLNESETKVRPLHKRTKILIRDVPEQVTLEEIKELFSAEGCPTPLSIAQDEMLKKFWNVVFATEDATSQAHGLLVGKTLQGEMVKACIKPTQAEYVPTSAPPALLTGLTSPVLTTAAGMSGNAPVLPASAGPANLPMQGQLAHPTSSAGAMPPMYGSGMPPHTHGGGAVGGTQSLQAMVQASTATGGPLVMGGSGMVPGQQGGVGPQGVQMAMQGQAPPQGTVPIPITAIHPHHAPQVTTAYSMPHPYPAHGMPVAHNHSGIQMVSNGRYPMYADPMAPFYSPHMLSQAPPAPGHHGHPHGHAPAHYMGSGRQGGGGSGVRGGRGGYTRQPRMSGDNSNSMRQGGYGNHNRHQQSMGGGRGRREGSAGPGLLHSGATNASGAVPLLNSAPVGPPLTAQSGPVVSSRADRHSISSTTDYYVQSGPARGPSGGPRASLLGPPPAASSGGHADPSGPTLAGHAYRKRPTQSEGDAVSNAGAFPSAVTPLINSSTDPLVSVAAVAGVAAAPVVGPMVDGAPRQPAAGNFELDTTAFPALPGATEKGDSAGEDDGGSETMSVRMSDVVRGSAGNPSPTHTSAPASFPEPPSASPNQRQGAQGSTEDGPSSVGLAKGGKTAEGPGAGPTVHSATGAPALVTAASIVAASASANRSSAFPGPPASVQPIAAAPAHAGPSMVPAPGAPTAPPTMAAVVMSRGNELSTSGHASAESVTSFKPGPLPATASVARPSNDAGNEPAVQPTAHKQAATLSVADVVKAPPPTAPVTIMKPPPSVAQSTAPTSPTKTSPSVADIVKAAPPASKSAAEVVRSSGPPSSGVSTGPSGAHATKKAQPPAMGGHSAVKAGPASSVAQKSAGGSVAQKSAGGSVAQKSVAGSVAQKSAAVSGTQKSAAGPNKGKPHEPLASTSSNGPTTKSGPSANGESGTATTASLASAAANPAPASAKPSYAQMARAARAAPAATTAGDASDAAASEPDVAAPSSGPTHDKNNNGAMPREVSKEIPASSGAYEGNRAGHSHGGSGYGRGHDRRYNGEESRHHNGSRYDRRHHNGGEDRYGNEGRYGKSDSRNGNNDGRYEARRYSDNRQERDGGRDGGRFEGGRDGRGPSDKRSDYRDHRDYRDGRYGNSGRGNWDDGEQSGYPRRSRGGGGGYHGNRGDSYYYRGTGGPSRGGNGESGKGGEGGYRQSAGHHGEESKAAPSS